MNYGQLISFFDHMGKNTATLTFYNPSMSTIGISVSVISGSVPIYMAEPLDKNVKGFPKAGEKRYNHTNPYIFSLTPTECVDIVTNFNSLVDGTFKREKDNYGKPVDEKYQGILSYNHNNKKFFIGPIESKMGPQPFKTLRVGIYDPEKTSTVTYIFRESELILVRKFLENTIVLFPLMTSFLSGVGKLIKNTLYTMSMEEKQGVTKNKINDIPEDNYIPDNSEYDLDIDMGGIGDAPVTSQEKPVAAVPEPPKPVEKKVEQEKPASDFDPFNLDGIF
jgi:hypothetical protein